MSYYLIILGAFALYVAGVLLQGHFASLFKMPLSGGTVFDADLAARDRAKEEYDRQNGKDTSGLDAKRKRSMWLLLIGTIVFAVIFIFTYRISSKEEKYEKMLNGTTYRYEAVDGDYLGDDGSVLGQKIHISEIEFNASGSGHCSDVLYLKPNDAGYSRGLTYQITERYYTASFTYSCRANLSGEITLRINAGDDSVFEIDLDKEAAEAPGKICWRGMTLSLSAF